MSRTQRDGEPTNSAGRRFELACWILFGVFAAMVPIGLSVAFGYHTAFWAWHRAGVAEALWATEEVPTAALPVVKQFAAMLGATIACWGLAMAWLAAVPLRRGERWSLICIAASVLLWFVFDSGLSAAHGVWFNVAFNSGALVSMALPWLAVWRMWPPRTT